MNEALSFRQDDKARRFVAQRGGLDVAYVEFDPIGAQSLLIKHTEVLTAQEGQGYGSALIRHVLDEARAQGRTVIPICTFTAKFIRDHDEYHDLVSPNFRAAMPR